MRAGRKVVPVALIAAGTIAVLGACGAEEPVAEPSAAMQTAFPGLEAASGEPEVPGLESAKSLPGTVEQVAGPFDDRFELEHLAVVKGAVSGELMITSDVSHLLDLQVVAGFFDAEGSYLGSERFDQHALQHDESAEEPGHEDEHDHDVVEFSIEAPAEFRAQVASAAISVPVLVNE